MLQKFEKYQVQRFMTFEFNLNVVSKLFSKTLHIWYEQSFTCSLIILSKWSQFRCTNNNKKSQQCHFKPRKISIFVLKVAWNPFSRMLLIIKIWFEQFLTFCLIFSENGFNFVTQNFQKTKKSCVQTFKTFVFDLKLSWK